ncbi:MAG: NADH-quinone oxidoreductase subunit C [Firmicutes bacterium]|nr:NADH-quinone oxidoreductase subunit C [Bacillota bacterium]
MPTAWVHFNAQRKAAGQELLALTADRSGTLRATWLDPSDGRQTWMDWGVSGGRFPSLSVVLPEVAWDEREIHDLFGYLPEGHPDLRPLVRTPRWPTTFLPLGGSRRPPLWREVEPDLPALQVQGEGVTIMKVGPTHAGIIESGHFVFSLIGENILHLDVHLFQNHRGLETLLEGETLDAVPRVVGRTCAADTVSHQTNWALAVEHLSDFTAPPALTRQRVVLLEAERVLSHLNDLAQIPAGVGFQVAHQRALSIKEYWQRCLKALFGHRFLFDTVRPGWAKATSGEALVEAVRGLRQRFGPWRRLVEGHVGFQDRMRGVGVTSLSQVIRLGAQGVAARAAGKPFDARQMLPWYGEFEVKPVTGVEGDVKARFMVRLEELEESLRILEAAAPRLPASPPRPAYFALPPDPSGRVVTFTESPHGLNVHDVTLESGRVVRYHIRAATFRNWPLLAQAVGGNAVADFPLINKSFELCYSCTDR